MLQFYAGTVLGETERGNELLDEFYGSLPKVTATLCVGGV